MTEFKENEPQTRTFYTDKTVLSDRRGVFESKVYVRQTDAIQEDREVVLADWRRGLEKPSNNIVHVKGRTRPDGSSTIDEDSEIVARSLLETRKIFPTVHLDIITMSAEYALDPTSEGYIPDASFQDNYRKQLKYRLTDKFDRQITMQEWEMRGGEMLFKKPTKQTI